MSSRFRATAVFDTEMSTDSDDAPSPQNTISLLLLVGVKRLQGYCNGLDGPFQRSTRGRSRARTRSLQPSSRRFHGWRRAQP